MTPVEEIKDRLDIVEVLSGYLKLRKAGKNFQALCPFHNEKTPSFMVSQERQFWHCFGCGESGDIFAFVMKIEGLDFPEALRLLARRAGVVLRRQDPKEQNEKAVIFEINEWAAKFFEKQLQSGEKGAQALAYLKKRGLKEKTIKDWRLGFAPDSWDGLSNFLIKRGYGKDKIAAAGLAIKKEETGRVYDRFRSRIMFPLFDAHGQTVGFAGRIFGKEDDKQGKYINSPQTLIYDKSRVLYGLHEAKQEIRKKDRCVVVEGNLDVILSQQAGFKETVAASGTALGEDQLKIIKRYTENLIFSFDGDEAGFRAAKKAVQLALSMEFSIKVVSLKKSQDPADVILEDPKKWKTKVKNALPFLDFFIKKSRLKFNLEAVQDKRKMTAEILPFVRKVKNPVERAHWLSKLSEILTIKEHYLYEALKKIEDTRDEKASAPQKAGLGNDPSLCLGGREERIREFVAGWLLVNNKTEEFKKEIGSFLSDDQKNILDDFKKAGFDEKKLLAEIKDEEKRKNCQRLIFLGEERPSGPEEVGACFKELEKINLKKEISRLGGGLKEAEKTGNKKKVSEILRELQGFLEKLNDLENNG